MRAPGILLAWAVLCAACGGNSGTAADAGAPCTTSDDCPGGTFCSAAEVCIPDGSCGVQADCSAGQACEAGACIEGDPCADADDCDSGQICSTTGTCIPEGTCNEDGDCVDADYCSQDGTCIPDGTCSLNADCGDGMICDHDTDTCMPGSDCGATELVIESVPPNLLLTLDRSCSMKDQIAGVTKWASAVSAINTLTASFDDEVRWGLGLFPDKVTPNCEQDAITIPVAADNEPAIQTLLTAALTTTDMFYPNGPCVTNIDTAMEQAAAQPELDDLTRKSFVMLITDGQQAGCSGAGGDNGTETIIGDLFTLRDVVTFVVGFGGAVDGTQLDTFATLGGAPLAGTPKYYQADNQTELETALETIAGLVVSCDYAITNPPADINSVFVFFDDQEAIPRDQTHTEGWDYDPATMTLTFYGSFCQRLKAHLVEDVDVVFGCAGPVVE